MNIKSRTTGGICLLAACIFLAVAACAPAQQMPTPVTAAVSGVEVQRVLLTEAPLEAPTEVMVETTDEPEPTVPPKPVATVVAVATARSVITLGDPRTVESAGFSFRPVIGYDLHLKPDQVTLVNRDGTIILSMTGVSVQSVGALNDRLEQLLSGVGEEMEEFEASTPYEVSIGEKGGLASDINGILRGEKVAGQVVLVAASESRLFYAVALVVDQPSGQETLSHGEEAIEAVIDSVTFVESNVQ